jgi:CspA family cold shock protein
MTNRIFISYAAKDKIYLKAVELLLQDNGIIADDDYIVVDPRKEKFESGENIRKSIKEQIQSASLVVILETANSRFSGWVNYEAAMADALDKPIVVVRSKGTRRRTPISNLSKYRTLALEEIARPSTRHTLGRNQGRVKWFDKKKGYGFVEMDDGSDVFVHYSDIKGSGSKSLSEGDVVEIDSKEEHHVGKGKKVEKTIKEGK